MQINLMVDPPRTTAQEKGERIVNPPHGKPFIVHYEKDKVKMARRMYAALLAQYVPREPMKGAVALDVTFCFRVKSAPKKRYKITRPDTDNSVKLLKDVMSDLHFWNDDSQVADEHCVKYEAPDEGYIIIRVNEL